MWDKLCDVLTDFEFLHAKLGAAASGDGEVPPATVYDLLRDYLNALEALPANQVRREEVDTLHRLLDENSHLLKEDPSLLVQQIHNACN